MAWKNENCRICCKRCAHPTSATASFDRPIRLFPPCRPRVYLSEMAAIKFGTDGLARHYCRRFYLCECGARWPRQLRATSCAVKTREKGVIVGYDHRYASDTVARRVAETFSSTGTPVWLTNRPCPTPAVSYLVRERAAAGGVVVTASHNPYQWNGNQIQGQLRQ